MNIKEQFLSSLYNTLNNFNFSFLGIDKQNQTYKDGNKKSISKLIVQLSEEYGRDTHKRLVTRLLNNQVDFLTRQDELAPFEHIEEWLVFVNNIIKQILFLDNIIGIQSFNQINDVAYHVTGIKDGDECYGSVVAKIAHQHVNKYNLNFIPKNIQDLSITTPLKGKDNKMVDECVESICTDIINNTLSEILKHANQNVTSGYQDVTSKSRLTSELCRHLGNIAVQSHIPRGIGNVIITSPKGVDVLKGLVSNMNRKFVPIDKAMNPTLQLVGTLEGVDKFHHPLYTCDVKPIYVYVSTHPELVKDGDKVTFLIGYRGTYQYDTGLVFVPNVLAYTSGSIVDDSTFERSIPFYATYGYSAYEDVFVDNDYMERGRTSDYYSILTVDTANIIN